MRAIGTHSTQPRGATSRGRSLTHPAGQAPRRRGWDGGTRSLADSLPITSLDSCSRPATVIDYICMVNVQGLSKGVTRHED